MTCEAFNIRLFGLFVEFMKFLFKFLKGEDRIQGNQTKKPTDILTYRSSMPQQKNGKKDCFLAEVMYSIAELRFLDLQQNEAPRKSLSLGTHHNKKRKN